jgi:Nuclease-related domain
MTAQPDPEEAEGSSPVVHPTGTADRADGTNGGDGSLGAGAGRQWIRRSGRDRRSRDRLEFVEEEGVIILNDRRIPELRTSIKYLAVAPAGVFVIDAKDLKGLVHTKRPGPVSALGPDELHIGRRNCTAMVGAIEQQVEAVRKALSSKPWAADVPVHAMLCLTRAQWGFASPIELGDVWVGWPKLVGPRVKSPVIMDSPMVNEVSVILSDRLPSG